MTVNTVRTLLVLVVFASTGAAHAEGNEQIAVLAPSLLRQATKATNATLVEETWLSALSQATSQQLLGQSDLSAAVGLERQKDLLGCDSTTCMAEIGAALNVPRIIELKVDKADTTWTLMAKLLYVRDGEPHVDARVVERVSGSEQDMLQSLSRTAAQLAEQGKLAKARPATVAAPAAAFAKTCPALADELEKANLSDASNEKLVSQVVEACTADKSVKSARPFISAGTYYVRQKKPASAVPMFKEALVREPDLPLAWIDLSAAFMDMSQFDDAVDAASHALNASDTHMRAMANHNDGLARFKKMAATQNFADTSSEEFFKAAVALEKIPDAWFYIGMVEKFQKNNAAEGQKYFKLACDAGHQGACAQLKK